MASSHPHEPKPRTVSHLFRRHTFLGSSHPFPSQSSLEKFNNHFSLMTASGHRVPAIKLMMLASVATSVVLRNGHRRALRAGDHFSPGFTTSVYGGSWSKSWRLWMPALGAECMPTPTKNGWVSGKHHRKITSHRRAHFAGRRLFDCIN